MKGSKVLKLAVKGFQQLWTVTFGLPFKHLRAATEKFLIKWNKKQLSDKLYNNFQTQS